MGTFLIKYQFKLPEGNIESFELKFDDRTVEMLPEHVSPPPEWARLEFFQCANCTLTSVEHPFCPLVENLVPIVQRFESILSYDEIELEVITEERRLTQHTTAQRSISSLMGLLFATSGCPHTVFFKPMARYHLPLASEAETIYRASSMYLLAQYFVMKQGKPADFEMNGLKKIYENIQIINIAVAKRLRAATTTDSTINAITLLDIYAKGMPFMIKDSLEDIRHLFMPFISATSASIKSTRK